LPLPSSPHCAPNTTSIRPVGGVVGDVTTGGGAEVVVGATLDSAVAIALSPKTALSKRCKRFEMSCKYINTVGEGDDGDAAATSLLLLVVLVVLVVPVVVVGVVVDNDSHCAVVVVVPVVQLGMQEDQLLQSLRFSSALQS
jgi:hypothetical protein